LHAGRSVETAAGAPLLATGGGVVELSLPGDTIAAPEPVAGATIPSVAAAVGLAVTTIVETCPSTVVVARLVTRLTCVGSSWKSTDGLTGFVVLD
jgi:hypothetical protein